MTDTTPTPPAPAEPIADPPQLSAAEIALGDVERVRAEEQERRQSRRRQVDDGTPLPVSLLEEDDVPAFSDEERLTASPLEEWFPGVTWRVLVTWLGGTCFQSTDATLTLIVESGDHTPAGAVRYTRAGQWEGGVIGYWGPVVSSPAEIGALLQEDAA